MKLSICSVFWECETWSRSQVQQVLDPPKADELYMTAQQFYVAKVVNLKHPLIDFLLGLLQYCKVAVLHFHVSLLLLCV